MVCTPEEMPIVDTPGDAARPPSALAASTNRDSRMFSTCPRTSLATVGHDTNPSTSTRFSRVTPTITGMIIASTRAGIAMNKSIICTKNRSTLPPRYPASRPIGSPRTVATIPAPMPTTRDIRAPWSTRLKTSRPRSSVPNQ